MSFVGAAIAGGVAAIGGVAGAAISSNAAGNAAKTQSDAALQAAQLQSDASKYATDAQTTQFNTIQANQKPWLQAGEGALSQLSSMTAQGAPTFTKQDFLNNQDPGYQFNLEQGQQALERSAAARGGLQNGGTLKDLATYSQGQASNEYQNAYNRFMNNQNTQFNRLSSIAGLGQTANGQLGQAGMNMANNVGSIATGAAQGIGNTMMGAANAQGAASIAQGNAWGNTLSGIGNNFGSNIMTGQMLSNMPKYGGYGGGGGGGGLGGLGTGSYTDSNFTLPALGG